MSRRVKRKKDQARTDLESRPKTSRRVFLGTLVVAIGLLGAFLTSVGAQEIEDESYTPTLWFPGPFRTIDGTNNNLLEPTWGSAGTQLLRCSPAEYSDRISAPAGALRPSPRAVSNEVCAQSRSVLNTVGATDFVWQWGQFLDHDLDLTGAAKPEEPFPVRVPIGDPFFDPNATGTQTIVLNRSIYDPSTGTDERNPRQQMNQITAFIDASNVYGSDPERAKALRTDDGTGRLKTSPGDLLPFNTQGLPNAGGPSASLFLAGDIRVNEQVGLTAMHTLFVREHNRLAGLIRSGFPLLSGDQIYEIARAIVGAELQVITYKEFLPVILGPNALSSYKGYNPTVNPGINNIFSTAAFRFGHSMLSPVLLRLDQEGEPIPEGDLPLRQAFFAPQRITEEGGIEPLLRGLAAQRAQQIDTLVVDDVRNFLFGPPGAGGFDLPSLNIQRGRDHGLPSYNHARIQWGLPRATSFADITSDKDVQRRLERIYGAVENIDVWVGGLAEDHRPGALLGELFFTILKDQFERVRDGDRFWYENIFSGPLREWLEKQTLAKVIRRNTEIRGEIQDNVFLIQQDDSCGGQPCPGDSAGTERSPTVLKRS